MKKVSPCWTSLFTIFSLVIMFFEMSSSVSSHPMKTFTINDAAEKELLSRSAADIDTSDLGALTHLKSRLIDTLIDSEGRGYAAPQIGESVRAFVYRVSSTRKENANPNLIMFVINPIILNASAYQEIWQGCFSVPLVFAKVKRPLKLHVKYTTFDGTGLTDIEKVLTADEAIIFQHEFDHLEGKTILDMVDQETDPQNVRIFTSAIERDEFLAQCRKKDATLRECNLPSE